VGNWSHFSDESVFIGAQQLVDNLHLC